ncbi:HEPN domain-containing protein [Streptomyces sp. CS014]|uniref:HEPN domain-containing protein n=1 Tax=Streptomyces sp. CS014 TaxID=2162707 RepID=UPI0013A5BA06|nr:HEPN domain-containing protein [Streptomyces sp. CS014]
MSDVIKLLTGAFGEEFVRFVLNISEPDNLNTIPNHVPAGVVQHLSSIALDSAQNGFADVHFFGSAALTSYSHSEGTSLVHVLRKACGGESLEAVEETEDPVLYVLRMIAQDCWPVYLITSPNSQKPNNFFSASPSGVMQHPKKSEAAEAFMRDASLCKLFPPRGEGARDKPINESAEWVVNVGTSGTRHLMGVLSGLLYDARLRVALAGKALTFRSISESLERSLGTLRLLAEGKEANVPAVIGFSGVHLNEGQSIRFTDGTLREVRPAERQLLLHGSQAVGAVYETTYPARILDTFQFNPGSDDWAKPFNKCRARIEESLRSSEYALDKVRLALVLSSEKDGLLAPKEEARTIIDPANMGGSGYWNTGDQVLSNTSIKPEKHDTLITIYDVIRKKHPESLNIAMTRLLSAVTSRRDSNDALIDALIAWENIFGTRTETTFRVTASLAKILTDTPEERVDLQKELARLYGVRSAMVHGAKEPTPDAAATNRERVIRVAIDALQALYLERPELLSMSPEDRSKRVLLEG